MKPKCTLPLPQLVHSLSPLSLPTTVCMLSPHKAARIACPGPFRGRTCGGATLSPCLTASLSVSAELGVRRSWGQAVCSFRGSSVFHDRSLVP